MQDHTIRDHMAHVVGRQDLAHELFVISEHQLLDAQHRGALDCLTGVSRPILNLSSNPVPLAPVRAFAQQVWGPDGYLMLTWDPGVTAPDLVYWPYFFLCQRQLQRKPWQPRCHRISMLSGIPRPHRVHLWRQIRSRVRDSDIVVINRFASWLMDQNLVQDLPWSNHLELIEPDQDRALTSDSTTSMDHAAYRACVNLPLETVSDPEALFVTEKTWKALVSGCLPWHGHRGLAGYLHQLGFPDWFQETGPAAITCPELFDRDDLLDFYHANLDQVRSAQDRFWSDHLVIHQTEAAIRRLENWIQA